MAKILLTVPGEHLASRVDGTVFQHTRYGLCAQRLGLQRLTPSAGQLRERSVFYQVSKNWLGLPGSIRSQFNAGAPPGQTGYSLYMHRSIPVYNYNKTVVQEYADDVLPVTQSISNSSLSPSPGIGGYILVLAIQLATQPAYPPTFGPLYYFVHRTAGVVPTLSLASKATPLFYLYNYPQFAADWTLPTLSDQGPITSGNLVTFWLTGVNAANGLTVLAQISLTLTAH